jgi:Tfp pilus assembly protein PilF
MLAAELLAVLDEIAAKAANALALRIDQTVLSASRRRKIPQLAVYECWLRGMECLQRGTVESDEEARVYFEQALAADPQYARAQAGLSLSHFNEWSCQAWESWETKVKAADECARRAEALDSNDAVVQVILGKIEQYRRQHAAAEARYRRALQLAPNDAFVTIQLAVGFCAARRSGAGGGTWRTRTGAESARPELVVLLRRAAAFRAARLRAGHRAWIANANHRD